MNIDIDIKVLSEIMSDTSFYLTSILNEYIYVHELYKDNWRYCFIKQELKLPERIDLKFNQNM